MGKFPPNGGKGGSSGGDAWGDLGLRTLSALVMVAATLVALWFGGPMWWALLGVSAMVLAAEWLGMCEAARFGGLYGARSRALWQKLAGLPYIAVPLVSLVWLRGDFFVGRANVLFVLMVVWASDVGAYLAGRAFGGPRLAPRISPGKTWTGAFGGLVCAAAIGSVALLLEPGRWSMAVGASVALGLAAQLGDLLESLIKRGFGVKDSGRLIPGHGGLLDRVDGLLLAAPIAAGLALVLGRGVMLWN